MFGRAKKDKIEEEKTNAEGEDIFEKISREMVTHNMPAQEKISGSLVNPSSAGKVSFDPSIKGKQSFKVVGIVIMVGGLLLVSLIVFLTYKFVIAPTASRNPAPVVGKDEDVNIDEKKEDLEASTTPLEITDNGVDIASTSADSVSIDVATSTPTEMPEESSGKDLSDLPPLADSDSDGLFDDEEVLFSTSITKADTDGDGYTDLAELLSGYDPSVKSGALKDSANFVSYQNSVYGFKFLYPKAWPLTEPRNDLVILSAADDSLVQVSVSRNEDGLGILAWFEGSFPDETASYDNLISRPGFEAIKSKNGLNLYITDEKRQNIIVVTYVPASAERLAYKNIYELIVKSFSF